MVAPLLSATGLVRRYGGRRVLDDVSLDVHPGEVVAVVGPNGAGKSTLFRLLLLLEAPDAGTVRLDGELVGPGAAAARRRLAGVFQRPVLFSGTVRDNVGYGLRVRGGAAAERARQVQAALGWFELTALAAANVHDLSGGEAQRVALARAVVTEPDVLLLDEPTAGLDASIRRRFRRDIEEVARQHARSIVVISHDAADAFGVADRVAVMEAGRVVQVDTPEQIVLRPATPFVAELTGAELLLHGRVTGTAGGLAAVRLAPDVVVWATPAGGSELREAMESVIAYRPEDVVLAAVHDDSVTSAMNRLVAEVTAIVPARPVVRVLLRLDGGAGRLAALLTARSVAALSLEVGTQVVAQLKATALHAWPRRGRRSGEPGE
jgi:molybdopterin-binding protein